MRARLAGLLVLLTIAAGQGSNPPQLLFEQAKAAIAVLPAGTQPLMLDYVAHREMLAQLNSAAVADLGTAFSQAVALSAANRTKAQVEYEAMDALLELGQLTMALELAHHADADRGAIIDRIVPEALGAGRGRDGWALWAGAVEAPRATFKRGFPFRAASALACLAQPQPLSEEQQRVLREAEAAAGQASNLTTAAIGVDWLESCAGLLPANVLVATAAALAHRLPPAGGNLEIARLRLRLTAIAARSVGPAAAAQATAPLPPPRPVFGIRRSPATPGPPAPTTVPPPRVGPPAGTPPAPPGTIAAPSPALIDLFANNARGCMYSAPEDTDGSDYVAGLLRANPALARYSPDGTAWLAATWFEMKKIEQFQMTANEAYAGAIAAAANFNPESGEALWPTASLQAFTLLAQMDLDHAAAAARSAPPMLKPLLLAAVARAAAAPPARLGKPIFVLH